MKENNSSDLITPVKYRKCHPSKKKTTTNIFERTKPMPRISRVKKILRLYKGNSNINLLNKTQTTHFNRPTPMSNLPLLFLRSLDTISLNQTAKKNKLRKEKGTYNKLFPPQTPILLNL